MSTVVYLDNAATTAVDPRVIEVMLECCGPDGDFANPSAVGRWDADGFSRLWLAC